MCMMNIMASDIIIYNSKTGRETRVTLAERLYPVITHHQGDDLPHYRHLSMTRERRLHTTVVIT